MDELQHALGIEIEKTVNLPQFAVGNAILEAMKRTRSRFR